jgi:NADH-ubiquinone oxidoreductase chain 5
MAGIRANLENDLKKVIALSTLRQLGVIIIRLSLGMPHLALYHLYTHAMFKALLFLCAGIIIHNSLNTQDIRKIGEIFLQAPLRTTCLNIANFALCGMPFLSGFYSKDLILESRLVSATNIFILVLLFLATGLTISYRLRLRLYVLWGPLKASSFHGKVENDVYVNLSTRLLALMAISGGILGQRQRVRFYSRIYLPVLYKLLPSFCILSGILVGLILWIPGYSSILITKYKRFCRRI